MTFFIGGMFVFLLLLHMFIEAKRNRIDYLALKYETLPEEFHGYRLFFISDVHKRIISKKIYQELINQVDIIIIGGDLCEKNVPLERIEENVKQLSAIAPCYFVWGNNDHEVGKENVKNILMKYHVKDLENKECVIKKQQDQITLLGLDDTGFEKLPELILPLSQSFSVLICHYPDVTELLPSNHPFSLILTGHTHGGQIRFFGFGIARRGGLFNEGNYNLLISNGYGTTALPFRLGAPAQTHIITLLKK
ncbi:metallophosphoesterase [Halalkalibacter krulwichiae]|uniref:Putative metallophosphoesterase n=1 Tax=Halalkalibacter krulwichiae TaxID=199441 RepID=A0A1X9MCA7_9BACI|nr:metallophosphoesterase [Halalkalibacter krulwichiae]ARK30274.1 putative metallophosphoesterase [Halalkalibacter krulwichiae]